jgi:hypothetical protein
MDTSGDKPHDGQMLDHDLLLFRRKKITWSRREYRCRWIARRLNSVLPLDCRHVRERFETGRSICQETQEGFTNSLIFTPEPILAKLEGSATSFRPLRGLFAAARSTSINPYRIHRPFYT